MRPRLAHWLRTRDAQATCRHMMRLVAHVLHYVEKRNEYNGFEWYLQASGRGMGSS